MDSSLALATWTALQNLWTSFITFLPSFIGALIIFFIGLIIATGISELVERILDALKIDKVLEKMGFKTFTDRAGIKLDAGFFVGQLTKWMIVLAFLSSTLSYLKLEAFSEFFTRIVAYLPNVIVAVVIFLITVLVADFVGKMAKAGASGFGFKMASFTSSTVKWAIYIVGFLTALEKLGVPTTYLNNVFTGLIIMFALAGGIAFGVGGKDVAADILHGIKKEIEDK